MKTSRRFTSERTANSFAKRTGGTVRDLRQDPNARSNFKVAYEKGSYNDDNDNHDFDSDINGNGTDWHTSDDL